MYVREFEGDEYIPSLNGITKLKKFDVMSDLQKFNDSHKYAKQADFLFLSSNFNLVESVYV